jgi:hypothetical protein
MPADEQHVSGNSPSPHPSPRGGEREELALIFDIVLRGEGETPFLDD